MGDFDRNETGGKKDETKKMVMVGALGVLLLGLIWFQFMKKSPEAMAEANGADAQAASTTGDATDQTPEQAMADLQNDPTAGLLSTPAGAGATDAKPPRNPFHMADAWRASLVKPAEPGPVTPTHSDVQRPHLPATPSSLLAENFKLSGIVRQGPSLCAIINNKIVTAGSIVGKARVIEIREDGVTLQHVDSADGPLLQLSSRPAAESN